MLSSMQETRPLCFAFGGKLYLNKIPESDFKGVFPSWYQQGAFLSSLLKRYQVKEAVNPFSSIIPSFFSCKGVVVF